MIRRCPTHNDQRTDCGVCYPPVNEYDWTTGSRDRYRFHLQSFKDPTEEKEEESDHRDSYDSDTSKLQIGEVCGLE
tara:strand:+ start:13739 stop:13966 length:228 start_codon:yes stop_codon:yes gene_type:complete